MKISAGWLVALGLTLLATTAHAQEATTPGFATFEFLDVGQGDAILLRSPEGKTALIDAGPSHHVVTLLKQRGLTALDLAVVSHHHADHYGGMLEVIRTFPPRVFLATGSAHTSEHYLRLLEAVRDQGAEAIMPSHAPRRIALGSVEMTVFPQAPEDPSQENNNSIGLRVRYGEVSALLPGDAEATERLWWERNARDLCANCDILKLAHHGSRNGTDARWLSLVRPRLAVASMGRDNEFGHPHHETVALLASFGIPFLRTDRDGTITVETDGRGWSVVEHPVSARGPPGPTRAREHASRPHANPRPYRGQRIDINTASEEELRTIPGIGAILARRIIAGRPYRRIDDLGNLQGIGKHRLAEIRPHVRVR